MASNRNLHAASKAKKDEFYTQLADIENELKHYRDHFRGAVVYCNCDDPTISNFYRYFYHNFARLGLKRLITTCYQNQNRKMFSRHDRDTAIGLRYDGANLLPEEFQLAGDGDFRSAECIELLRQADIVVTNPPFSLFREYVAQLIEHEKKFLIIGNMNAITYKEIFPLIKDGELWLGHAQGSFTMLFDVPKDYAQELVATKNEGSAYEVVDGIVKGKLRNAKWFTNLDYEQRHEDLILYKRYSPEEYPHYDNYDAINVDKTKDIPLDYEGAMGVPISFLDRHNPEQFEIIRFRKGDDGKDLRVNGKEPYFRIIIKNKSI